MGHNAANTNPSDKIGANQSKPRESSTAKPATPPIVNPNTSSNFSTANTTLPQTITDFSLFNNSPAILARGTRSVSPGAIMILVDGLGLRNSTQLQTNLTHLFGFDYSNKTSVYPYNLYLDIAEYLRANHLGNMSVAKGYEELGYRLTQVYFQSVAGQVFKITGKIMGIQRAAAQFIRLMSHTLPWGIHELPIVKPNHLTYRKRLVGGPPPIMAGVLRGALEITGAKEVRVSYKVLSVEEDDILYEANWQ